MPYPTRTVDVRISRGYWIRQGVMLGVCALIALPLLFLGSRRQPALIAVAVTPPIAWLAVSIHSYRRGPARIGPQGITRRDQRHFPWTELDTLQEIQAPSRTGGTPYFSHWVIRFRTGEIPIFPATIDNVQDLLAAVRDAEATMRDSRT
ncbi:hypothetical protein F183_A13730 [Bryobacterales bacterium F-183]|nr:hypothetical protein F183_A13730 [Bryobacterales bacterium F-183]